jgi:CRP-like cAMP-binding protein
VLPEYETVIRRLETLHTLPAGGGQRVAALLRLQDLPKGGYFVRAGEIPTRIGYILCGWLQYFYTNADGKKLVRYFCKGENFVSSQSALTRGAPSAFSIQALEDSKLVVFKYRDWLQLLETHPAWAIMHKTLVEQALMRSEERERSLILDDAATRYRRFLEEFPGAEQHIKQYDIASYLGISPVTLSRIRGSKAKARPRGKLA